MAHTTDLPARSPLLLCLENGGMLAVNFPDLKKSASAYAWLLLLRHPAPGPGVPPALTWDASPALAFQGHILSEAPSGCGQLPSPRQLWAPICTQELMLASASKVGGRGGGAAKGAGTWGGGEAGGLEQRRGAPVPVAIMVPGGGESRRWRREPAGRGGSRDGKEARQKADRTRRPVGSSSWAWAGALGPRQDSQKLLEEFASGALTKYHRLGGGAYTSEGSPAPAPPPHPSPPPQPPIPNLSPHPPSRWRGLCPWLAGGPLCTRVPCPVSASSSLRAPVTLDRNPS